MILEIFKPELPRLCGVLSKRLSYLLVRGAGHTGCIPFGCQTWCANWVFLAWIEVILDRRNCQLNCSEQRAVVMVYSWP